jgi:TolA-binding protein
MFFGISKNGMTLQSAITAPVLRMLIFGLRFFILIPFLLVCLSVQAQKSQVDTEPNQLYFQGLDYVKQQNFTYAKELFTKYIERKEVMNEKKSQDLVSNAKFYRALCALELGQPDAEKLFEDYIKQEDESPTKKIAYYHLGRLLFDNKKYKEAIKYFEQVDQYDLSRSERDEYRFELAYCYFHSKKLDEAYKLFRQTKDVTNKYYYPSNYYYGYISYTQKKFDDALQSFEKLKESKTYEKIIPYYIAQIYFQRKQYDKVIEYLQPLIGESSLKYYEELNLILGQANYEKKNYEKAIKHIKIYVDRNKPRKEELYQLGYAYYQTKKYNEAITNLQQLDDLTDSIGQSALYILGDCFLKTGNKQNALSAFQKASKIDIDKFIVENSFFNYAKLSYELGYDKQAIVAFQSFINDYPDSEYSEDAKGILSDLLLTTKNYKDALVIIESIQNKTPKVKKAYQQIAFLRGLEVYNDKNYQEAIRLFNVSLKNPIAPDFKALSYYWLGECNYQLEQYSTAFNEYVKFLELAGGTDIKDANWYLTNANYSAGYAQFKQQQYAAAAKYFAQAIDKSQASTKPEAKSKIYPDASLRNGDCNFMLKNYPVAINSYDVVAQNNAPGSDYALFQKGTILGLQGRYEEKIQTLEKVAVKYPTSAYNDDAQYNIGDAYVSLGKSQTAATTFNNLIQKYPNSPFVSKSYLKLGLIYYNQDNVKKSIESYKIILDKYPKSNDAKEALIALKDMSIAEGDPDIYMDIISSRKDIQVSVSEKDSISFLAAETRYAKGQCDEAIKKFDDYLTNFPNGYFLLQAYFYRSECLFKTKKYVESVKGYEYVANAGMNIYREKALAKASEINYYELKDYTNAEKYYLLLLENASNNDNIFIANLGLMRCAYHQNNLSQANTYAEKILGSNQSTPEQVIEANFYVAKYNQLNKSYGTALNHYKKVAAKTTNIMGAESQYQIAFIHFEENKLKEAEDESFRVIDNFSSYDYWYIKAYILIADIYEKQGNLFQAKATLQSVIENAEDEKLKAEALDKLNKIYDKETKTSSLVPDGMNIDAPLDTIEIK